MAMTPPTPHHTYIYESSGGSQVAVEVWPDGIDVKFRPTASAIWGLPLKPAREEGPAVQFIFGEDIAKLQLRKDMEGS